MEKSWVSVKLSEASVGVDSSDVTVTFRLSLCQRQQGHRDMTEYIYISETLMHFIQNFQATSSSKTTVDQNINS